MPERFGVMPEPHAYIGKILHGFGVPGVKTQRRAERLQGLLVRPKLHLHEPAGMVCLRHLWGQRNRSFRILKRVGEALAALGTSGQVDVSLKSTLVQPLRKQ